MSTTTTLVADLMRKPPTSFRDELIVDALAGRYHDFKSPLELPKVALVEKLTHYGFRDLARKAMRGDYDEEPDADDRAELAGILGGDERLRALFAELDTVKDDPAEVIRRITSALAERRK